ncbi:energy transducer TonB [Tenacibaculum sp. M341]|uniref:energy transducer TonB n=1 Tax=Tenacibaculum sp. M341 TaxID=2530339 RepID=UPI00104D35BF|nr:energy transducer TonB [Tenacibaculum sp. M341]TCI90651.1 energy transducer TonB [Tenacibaculum sp. M341]
MNTKLKIQSFLWLFVVANVFAQSNKTCNNSVDDPVFDLNSITKCSLEKADDNKKQKITVQVTSRRRVVRKRDKATGIASSNRSQKLNSIKKKVGLVNNIIVDEDNVPDVLPFDYVDQIPLFKKCQAVPMSGQEKCFKMQVLSHIKKNLKYPSSAYQKKIQGKVYAHFVINKEGEVDQLKIVSPYKGEILGKEAERIIKKLPKFTAGEHNGKAVEVKYGMPITFKIPGVKPSNIRKSTGKTDIKELIYSFSSLDEIPQFNSCKKADDSSLNCFNSNLINHIQNYFAYPEQAKRANIEGDVVVNFVVDKKGNIVNIKSKGPENARILELAATRFIEKLPKLRPGKKGGKEVNTSYSFPIEFKLH